MVPAIALDSAGHGVSRGRNRDTALSPKVFSNWRLGPSLHFEVGALGTAVLTSLLDECRNKCKGISLSVRQHSPGSRDRRNVHRFGRVAGARRRGHEQENKVNVFPCHPSASCPSIAPESHLRRLLRLPESQCNVSGVWRWGSRTNFMGVFQVLCTFSCGGCTAADEALAAGFTNVPLSR
jgi:hypothetical protein